VTGERVYLDRFTLSSASEEVIETTNIFEGKE
jgi:hypothetical protein